jgi:putative Mg2+ transporter-C (MgtC) family protein
MIFVQSTYFAILIHLLVALGAGSLIGFERSYQGRPAGFRTHALVCMASSALMLVTVYQAEWFSVQGDIVRIDPTRMAQGIMTGIGFLGAGVIVKEGPTVRGLTTAASLWITAAIGVLAGCGFYFPVILTTVLTLGTLSIFRWIERKMPTNFYMQHTVRFAATAPIPEPRYRELIESHGFSLAQLSYAMGDEGRYLEYRMILRTKDPAGGRGLAEALAKTEGVHEFQLVPAGD